jgi:hypothetical protein
MTRKTTLSNIILWTCTSIIIMVKKFTKNATQCNSMWLHTIKEVTLGSWTHQNVRVMKNVNTNISLHTYTCTSYFQEYIVDNKYENVNIMSY